VIAPVEALLEVTAYPDTDIAAMSFYFWHRLSHELMEGCRARLAEGQTLEEAAAQRTRRHQLFCPAFVRLIQNIMGRENDDGGLHCTALVFHTTAPHLSCFEKPGYHGDQRMGLFIL